MNLQLNQEALDKIRKLILTGKIEVDTLTSERQLAERLGLSRTPVREALAILSGLGLIHQFPQKGIKVRRITPEEVKEILRIRTAIESAIVEELSRARDADIPARLRQLLTEMEQTPDLDSFGMADTLFHCEMARLGKFSISIGTIRGFRDRLQLFRLTKGTVRAANWRSEVVTEHQAILDGIRDASVQDTVKALQDHFIATGKRLLPNMIQFPEIAAD